MKKTILLAVFLAILVFSSCSQEENTVNEQQHRELRSPSSVKDLTAQLKVYNSQFYLSQDERVAVARLPKISYSKLDIICIAISDCKGAVRGAGGGIGGVIVGAASSSLLKFATITAKKLLFAYMKDRPNPHKLFGLNNNNTYKDSIGIYHNEIEYFLYSKDKNCYRRQPVETVNNVSMLMQTMSSGYRETGGLTNAEKMRIAKDVNDIQNIDNANCTFTEYCNKLKELNPEDSDYIDYCAEYLYTAVYANLSNLDDYTASVVYQIRNSNIAAKNKELLYYFIQIAYASILYSQNMQFNNISN